MSNPTSFVHRHRKAIAQIIMAVYLANPLLVTAQVILNASTPNDGRRAFVDQTQNGITKVNIASPNGAGVSHNTYQQFDVPKAGVVLNNGATNSNTRLAGWVEGNPNLLPGQEAKLILNEVVGGKPSQLQGYVEVAGKKADVIIANEYGVTCNGCGFINTERTTLTTGKPVFNGDGSLGQLRVEQGQIQIGTEGLQATGSRLDILSRYVNVQGAVHADQINVVTGSNTVDYVNGQTTRLQTPANGKPRGLDVGQLGGMYANQITLMATGQGVGVNLDGQLLGAGQVSIQSDGTLRHKGTTQGDSGVRIEANELVQSGQLQSQQTIQVQAGKLNNSGTLLAVQQVQLLGDDMVQAGAIQARQIQINATGNIDNSGTLTAGTGGLSVQAGATLENRTTGRMQSQAQITLQAAQLNNAGQIMAQSDVRLQAQDLQNNASIQAVGQLTAQAQRIQNSATLLANGVTLTSQTLSNSGRIEGERLTLQAQDAQSTLTNSGQIAGSHIQIQGHAQLNNTGKISTAVDATASTDNLQNLSIQVGQLNNNGGQLIARNQLDLQTERLDNRSGTIATIDGDLRIQSNAIDNRSGQILQQGATKVMHLRATGALHNGSGQIEGQGQTLNLEAAELSNNSGQIQHTATVQPGQAEPVMTVTVTPSAHGSGQLQNIQGTLSATGQLRIQAHALITDASDPRRSQSSTLQFMDKAAAQSGSAPSGSGYDWQADIAANEKANGAKAEADQKAAQAQTAAQQLTQANTLLSQAQTQKSTTASALTQAQADLSAAQTQATAAQAAAQAAPQDATLAQAAQTAQGQVSTAQNAVNQAQTADQQAQTSLTQAQADAQVAQASKAAADSANATAQADYLAAQAEVKTVTDGTSGSSTSASDVPKPTDLQLSTPTSPAETNSGSLVQAGRKLTLTLGAGGLDNRQGRLQGQDIQVQTQGDIWAGQINAQNSLSLQADQIEAEQRIQAKTVHINAQRLNNTGRIEGTQELQIEAQRLDNSGTLQSANTQLQGQTPGSPTDLVLNNSGLVQGYVNLNIDGVQVLNTGTLSAGQAQIRGTDQLENRGVIFSTGNMSLQGQDIVNNQARIYSMGDLTVEGAQAGQAAGSVFNYAGRIEAQGDVNINADTVTNRAVLPSVNQRGFVEHISQDGKIITRATDTFNADGKKAEIIAGKKLNITAKTVNNDYGILSAWHQVNVTADTLNNTAYGAIQTENMVVKAACYNCHQTVRYADSWGGRIESGGAANLRALVINNRTTDTRDGFAGLSSDPRVVIVDERSGTQSPLTKAFVDRFGIVTGPSTTAGENAPAPLPGPRLLSDNLVLTAYGRFDFSRFVLPDGKTGLFELADPASPYLIQGRTDLIPRETGAQNTVYNQFLGSDYLMTRLGLIPGGAKRLGDAWYETQLVQEQLYALSGRRYLVAGTTSDYDLMRSLMDAGLLAQAQLRLVAGDPLSPEQQQALKQDVVWPEWQDVAGQRVLVPKVYLAQKQDVPGSAQRQVGALIAGQTVDIQTTELNQSHGHIAAGGPLNINAKGAVQGSGSYSGGTSVAVVAGNIDLANASVQSAGWLKLQTTQGDLNLAAIQVKAAGDATLQSAGALNLTAQKHEAHVVRGDGSAKDEVKYETTNIQAGGSATITSAGDLTAQGSTISAGQDLKLQSTGGRVQLQAVTNTEDVTVKSTARTSGFVIQDTESQEGSSSLLSVLRQSTTTQKLSQSQTQDSVGVTLKSGGSTQVQGAQDVTLQGTQIQAGQNIQLQSDQGNVQLQAITDIQNTQEQTKSTTQTRGFFGRLIQQNLDGPDTQNSQINHAEQSLQGVRLQSGGSTQIQAAKDIAAQSLQLQASQNAQLQAGGQLTLDSSTVDAKGTLGISAAAATIANSLLQSGNNLGIQTTQGDLTLSASDIKAAGNATLDSAGTLQLLATEQKSTVDNTSTTRHNPSNVQAGGNATLTSQRDLTVQGSTISAGQDLKLQSTGGSVDLQALKSSSDTSSTSTSGRSFFARTSTTTTHTEAVHGPQLQAGGNAQVLAAQNLNAQSLQLQAGGNATLAAAGTLALTSEQAYSRTTTGSDVRQSLQTERTQIQAAGNTTLYGQQAVQIDAADVRAGGNARVSSQGSVVLGSNTDTEQRNWTTSSSSSTWYGKTKTTTTQHQTLDQEAERTRIQAGSDAVVLGTNVGSIGAQVSGKTLTQIEGADQTLLYDVQEVHQYSANSQTRKGFLGITYSKSSSQDSSLQSNALPTELKSDQAVRVGVGAVTDVRGAVLTAPQIEFYRSANADTTKPGELILGASTNTSQTSHTEKTTTAGVWQAQSGQGQTSQTANQTQINGQLVIGQGIQTKVQIPEGALKDQIMQLASQPGQGYMAELASNPKVNWEQIKLVHDQWQYSQQGLTGAGAALLAIVVAYATAGMGTALVGTTTTTAATATTAAVSTTTAAGTTLATTTAATASTAAVTVYSAAGAALNAGFSALASSAAVSFVNNGGDLGQTLKDLGSKDSIKNILISMATAGALNELGKANLIGNKALSQITAADGFTANLGKSLINNMASATMNSALTGAKLEDSLKTALTSAVISAGAGQAASTIGDMTKDSPAVKALAHALAGCVAGAAGSGSQGCQSGAIGAVVGELAAQWYDPTGNKPKGETLEFVKVVSAAAGALTGDASAASVNTAVMTGVNAAENNYLNHTQWKEFTDKLTACKGDSGCEGRIRQDYVQLSKLQDAELATCNKRGDCATLKNDVMQGRDAMLTLVNTGKLPDAYAGAMDMQYMGQRLATDATFRKQVANSVEYMNWCGKNASACNQDQLQKAAGMSMLVLGPVIAVNPQLVAAVLLAQNGERASSAVIGGGVNVLAQALSSGQVDSVDVLKAAATAYATAGASLATTTAVNVGAEGAVSWAKDESQSEALSKMLLSALGTGVGYKLGDIGKNQISQFTDSFKATLVSKPTGFLTIEGPYSKNILPSSVGSGVGSVIGEKVSTYSADVKDFLSQFLLLDKK